MKNFYELFIEKPLRSTGGVNKPCATNRMRLLLPAVLMLLTVGANGQSADVLAAMKAKLGFDRNDYTPYMNVDPIKEVLNKNIDLESFEMLLWSRNTKEFDAVYDGTFATTDNDAAPAGWSMSNNTFGEGTHSRVFNNDARLSNFMNATNSGLYIRFDGYDSTPDSKYYYGKTEGYTMPLKANTYYKISFNFTNWNATTANTLKLRIIGPNDEEINTKSFTTTQCTYGRKDTPDKAEMIFQTKEAGDYVIELSCTDGSHRLFIISNISLKRSVEITTTHNSDTYKNTYKYEYDVYKSSIVKDDGTKDNSISIGEYHEHKDTNNDIVEFYSRYDNVVKPFPLNIYDTQSKCNFKFYRTGKLNKGDYRISVYALYRNGNGDGTNVNRAYLFADKVEGDKKTRLNTKNLVALQNKGDEPNTMDAALEAFDNKDTKGSYQNDLYISVDKDDTEIEFGIEGYFASSLSWCIFKANFDLPTQTLSDNDEIKSHARIGEDVARFYTGRYACTMIPQGKSSDYREIWYPIGWENLIKMYLGGWKYQGIEDEGYNKYNSGLASVYKHTKPTYQLKESKDGVYGDGIAADFWKQTKQENDFGGDYPSQEVYDGNFVNNSFARENAMCEYLATSVTPKYVYKFPARGNEFGKGNPFTLPCFGGFMKFEPETNGTVELYVVQNGMTNLSSSDGETGIQTNVSWRPTYIVDELGNLLTDATAETRQKVFISREKNTEDEERHESTNSETDVDKFWQAVKTTFKGWDKSRVEVVKKYWTDTEDDAEIIPPSESNDGWVAINKSYIKYTFKVQAGKSYYVFNNNSGIGFCGYEFIPDAMPLKDNLVINDGENYTPAPGNYKSVTIQRKFKQGWNAICLPFSVTESKMRKAFGRKENNIYKEYYELVTYNGAEKVNEGEESTTEDGSLIAHFFHHAYQDIIAGYPYMIYIPKGAEALNEKGEVTFDNVTIEDNVELAKFSSCTDYIPDYIGSSATDDEKKEIYSSTEDDFTFVGNFAPTTVRKGSYVVYSDVEGDNVKATGIRLVTNDNVSMNGLRSHLHASYYYDKPEASVSQLVRIAGTNFQDVLDEGVWNDATVINDLAAELGFFNERENVYSVTGQLVRLNSTSLVGLPKGVYIVNGKKYFVK